MNTKNEKHTPGPWELDIPSFPKSRASILVHRKGLSICRTNGTSDTCKANARLIAAAPELLAACELLAAWDKSYDDPKLISEACSIARYAIRKARGEA